MRLTRSFSTGLMVLLALAPVSVSSQEAQSRGWVGVVYSASMIQVDRAGSVAFGDYPIIESIEPGSPAERAGLLTGDMIISINSQDLRKNPIPMRSLLEPGHKIVFRYKRNNEMKSSTVLVEPRPAGNPERIAFSIIGGPTHFQAERARVESGANQRVVIRQSMPPMVELNPLAVPSGIPNIGIVGALLTQLNDGLRDALGVKGNGVFVINVEPGMPAGEAGLKSGDVILRADREAVENPGKLIRIMHSSADKAVQLMVIRKQKAQTITLRW